MDRGEKTKFQNPAFTLIETVISIGILATLLAVFMAMFGVATESLHGSISGREANRLISALDRELSILRTGEEVGDIRSAFDKAYSWIDKSSRGEGNIFLYSYLGDPANVRDDGSYEPVLSGGDVEAVAAPVARFVEGGSIPDEMREELGAVSGPVLFVRATQLVYEDGELVRGEPGVIPPHEGQVPLPGRGLSDSAAYPEAVIAFEADFFLLPTNEPEYVANFSPKEGARPDFSRAMAVRR